MFAASRQRYLSTAFVFLVAALTPGLSVGQEQAIPPNSSTLKASSPSRLGVEIFGGASIAFPAARESFEAVGLESRPIEFGGGGRVTGLWRNLFAQVVATRWSDTGERVFIDSNGARFPLGIPLDVKATYVDMTVGWKNEVRSGSGRATVLPYVGAGAGVAIYSESSPFSEPGDDLDMRAASYHVLLGAEFPLVSWLAVSVDGRYRHVPGVLGEGGVSETLDEEGLGGFQTGIALRVGFRRQSTASPRKPAKPGTAPDAEPDVRKESDAQLRITAKDLQTGMILETAAVYLRPDATRIPLRQLTTGTNVRILEEGPDWLRVEFHDPQFGPRVGWVLRKFVQIRKQ